MSTPTQPTADVVAFLGREVEYWREEARRLHQRITDAMELLGGPAPGWTEPPEPPVGTQYVTRLNRDLVFVRRVDGWHCAGEGCRSCPTTWPDLWEWEVGRPAAARWERRHGEPLPSDRQLVRHLPDHAEPECPF